MSNTIHKNNIIGMGKKNKEVIKPKVEEAVVEEAVVEEAVVEEAVVEITSTEIQIISNENLNFKNFKIKKGEIVVISDEVFKKLCEETPNLKAMLTKGVIELVN